MALIAEEDFRALASSVDRRLAWGAGDELGALRFVTAAATLAAAAEVRDGTVIACASRSRGALRTLKGTVDVADEWLAVNETVSYAGHGPDSMTHLDSLGHFFYQGRSHADADRAVVGPDGVRALDVVAAASGIAGRGLLLDLAAIAGTPHVHIDRVVTLGEIRGRLEQAGVAPRAGDILFVRTGAPLAPEDPASGLPAVGTLGLECARWIHDERFSLIVSDAGLDTPRPTVERVATPWHVLAITRMGLSLVDFADLEALAAACTVADRLTFLAVVAAPPLAGATSAPVNPLAVL